ncbi:MAG: HAD-IA family hydrolase [Sedimentisphaerales bacterium]|nr:HAD-IA family hydrolase [Sedimentisphaerales bacterium]
MAEIKAIIFDQDGVIIDTERDGHRVAFNETFKEFGFDAEWDVEYYHELLQIAGGKERMKHHLETKGFGVEVDPDEVDELIKKLHKRKTEIFVELIESGKLPLRPGVKRVMQEAMDAGLIVGVCTTSNEKAANAVAHGILKDIKFAFVLAGDIVKKKKPDPEIYTLALEKTGLEPEECMVVEDSHNGVLAAKAAGMHCIATTNGYTENEDLSQADIIVSCLGDPDGEKGTLSKGGDGLDYDGVLKVSQLVELFSK